jgi:hypothetical protein
LLKVINRDNGPEARLLCPGEAKTQNRHPASGTRAFVQDGGDILSRV